MPQTTISFSTLKTNYSWADGQRLTETKLDNILGTSGTAGLQTFCNDVNDNLDQIRLDAFGTSYTYDNDAAVNFTAATLYNKQVVTDTYSSNISLGVATDPDFVDVDATNAAITFTPDTLTGDFKATFQFTDHSVSTANTDIDCETVYRLTDGTTNSNTVKVQHRIDGTGLAAGDVSELCIPLTLIHVFTGLTATSRTIRLQKRVLTASNVATHDTDGAATNVMYMVTEK